MNYILNPNAKFLWNKNIKMYSYSVLFLKTEKDHVVEIIPHGRQKTYLSCVGNTMFF